MTYETACVETDEGSCVSVPRLPGCWSQGVAEAEALESARGAVSEYLAVHDELLRDTEVRNVEVVEPVPKLPGINHLDAVRALQKAGFRAARPGMHIVITDGTRILSIARHNPVDAFKLGGIVRDAGLNLDEFKRLLCVARQGASVADDVGHRR